MNVHVAKVVEDLYVLRLDDFKKKYFEGLWHIPEGITYNAYVLTADEGAIVFDSWDVLYADLFVETLQKIVDLRDIKIIVVHHAEPDHSGSIPKLLERVGIERVTILGHRFAEDLLKYFYGVHSIKFQPVKDGDSIAVGNYTLRFIHTPMLHWPDTIMTYIPQLNVLLTGDAFGSFSAPNAVFDDELADLDGYLESIRKYVVSVIGKYREFITKAIDKLVNLKLDVRIIAPAHGIIWRSRPDLIMDYYYRISNGTLLDDRKIVIIYCSMYGLKDNVIVNVKKRLEERGYKVVLLRFSYDDHAPIGNVLGEIIDAALIIVVASVYEGEIFPMLSYILNLAKTKIRMPKKVIGVLSYGWSPAKELFETRLREAGFEIVDIICFRGKGSENVSGQIVNRVLKVLASKTT